MIWLEDPLILGLNIVEIKNPFGFLQTNPQADAWWVYLFCFKCFFRLYFPHFSDPFLNNPEKMPVLGIRIRMCWVRINYQLFGFCNETQSSPCRKKRSSAPPFEVHLRRHSKYHVCRHSRSRGTKSRTIIFNFRRF